MFSRIAQQRWLLLAALLVYACLFQGMRPLYSPDEGRYTDVALGMLDDGDWLTPMVHPEFEHMTKPPMTYWAIATSVAVFGKHEFAARLPNALAFAGTILLLWWMGKRVTTGQRWRPALIYATSIFPFVASNIVTTDTLLTFWETLQLAAFAALWWPTTSADSRYGKYLLWLGAACAFMTKGPPGLLVLLGCLVFAGTDSGWRGLARVVRWDGLLLFLIVGCSWYAIEVIRDPQMLHYFLVDELVDRVATANMHRNAEWYDGFKIYFPVLIIGTLPWWPFAAVRLWPRRGSLKTLWASSSVARWLSFCVVIPLFVFMVSRSRLPLYILPLFPPLASLIALGIGEIGLETWPRKFLIPAWCAVLICLRGASGLIDARDDDRQLARDLQRVLPAPAAEVAFVEVAPRYGLRFYLGATIERLTLPGRRMLPSSEDFVEEMSEDEGCRVLIVDDADLSSTEAALRTSRVDYRRASDVHGYVVLLDHSADCPAYAIAASK